MNVNNKLFKLIMIVILIGIFLFLVTGCSGKDSGQSQQTLAGQSNEKKQAAENSAGKVPPEGGVENSGNDEVSVEVEEVQNGTVASYVTLTGEARPNKGADIVSRLQEEVEKINIQVGDRVNKGDILIRLNNEDNLIDVKKAEASLEAAKSNLQEALNGTREEELEQLRAEVEKGKSNLNLAKTEYERSKELFEQEFISQQKYEQSLNEYVSAKSSYQSTKQSLKLAEAGSTEEEIKSLEAQVAQAEASLESAKLKLSRTKIRAPIEGIVSDVSIEVGEMTASSPVITISQLNKVKIKTYVSQSMVNKVQTGESVNLDFEGVEGNLKGKIKSISPVADNQRKNFPVEIVVDNSNYKIKAGMYAEVKLKINEAVDVLFVSPNAIVEEDDGDYVYLIEDNKAKKVKVKTGLTSEKRVVILNGLEIGDKVVTTGKDYIEDASKVNIVNRGDI